MGLTSLVFFIFLIMAFGVYYLTKPKYRYLPLLLFSVFFLFYNALSIHNILAVLIIFMTSYIGGLLIDKSKNKRAICYLGVGIILLELIYLKYLNLGIDTLNILTPLDLKHVDIISPLGLSYYSLIMISYLVSIYWGNYHATKNPFRLACFMIYFPILTSGPFIQYDNFSKECEKPKFNKDDALIGIFRMLIGLFKVLVIYPRLNIFISAIYGNLASFNPLMVFLAILLYSLELYTNFSGSMDIVIGVSNLFGIHLPENFDNPFASKSITEFWRRWHITLGTWLKNYLFYPVLKSKMMVNLNKAMQKRFGKKGRKVSTYLALFILWMAIGIWHGGAYKFILASGLLQFIYIVIEDILKVPNKKSDHFDILRIIRTYLLFSLSMVFFRASSVAEGLNILGNLFIFKGGFALSLISLNLGDYIIMILSLLCLFIYDAKRDKIHNNYQRCSGPLKVLIIGSMMILVLLLGMYGINFHKTDFIYGRF